MITAAQIKNQIKTETGLNVSIKKGTGSMEGYTIFTTKKTESFEYSYSRNFIKNFPACDIKPAFANNYQIAIYHGIEA
jgi:hypothetical protein